MQSGAGADALIPDAAFADAGAQLIGDPPRCGRRRRRQDRAARPRGDPAASGRGSILIGFLAPLTQPETTRALADAGATAFAMEAIPRISRAQSMDALSSQANVAGYKAALLGAEHMRPLLPDADDRGRHDPAREGARARRRRRRPAGARHRPAPGRAARPATTCAPRSPSRSSRSAPSGSTSGIEAGGEGGYARELTDEEQRPAAAGADRRDQGLRRRHHDRARARAPGAEARHRRGRRGHEARLGDRRPRRRGGRQLRADRARRDGRSSTT